MNGRLSWLIGLSLAISMSVPVPAARFVRDFIEWRALSVAEKRLYAAGMFEAMTLLGGNADQDAIVQGLDACASELQLTPTLMAAAISRAYERHVELQSSPALDVMFDVVVRGICLQHINRERRARQLDDW